MAKRDKYDGICRYCRKPTYAVNTSKHGPGKCIPAEPEKPKAAWAPLPFSGLRCHCGELHYQSGRYYVTVRRDDGDSRALVGPFAEHDEALAWVPAARRAAERDPRAHWYSYGTAVMKYGYDKPGILNADMGLAA